MNFTAEDFERWLAFQEAMGLKPTNPEEIERIRAALKKGATLTHTRESQLTKHFTDKSGQTMNKRPNLIEPGRNAKGCVRSKPSRNGMKPASRTMEAFGATE